MPEAQIRYTKTSDGVSIAYSVQGEGPALVYMAGGASHLTAGWRLAVLRKLYEALARRHTLILFDKRGNGLSQRSEFEHQYELDLPAVVDALQLKSFALFAESASGQLGIPYAATCPDRVSRLVLWTTFARRDHALSVNSLTPLSATDWTTYSEALASVLAGWQVPEEARQYAALIRESTDQEAYVAFRRWRDEHDVTGLLPSISVPTLVVHRQGGWVPLLAAQELVSGIPNAQLHVIESSSAYSQYDEIEKADWLFEFLGSAAPTSSSAQQSSPAASSSPSAAASGMKAILFTDIADSTALTERMGDAAFRSTARALDERMRAAITGAGGSAVDGKLLGDGVMAVFTSAAQAIEAAQRCIELSAESELRLHIGLHAGDAIHEGGNVYGGAVNLAARVCALSAPGEILVSSTMRELARTSAGATFEDRGEHALKGIDDAVRVFAVRAEGA